jgi:hypothetical protein
MVFSDVSDWIGIHRIIGIAQRRAIAEMKLLCARKKVLPPEFASGMPWEILIISAVSFPDEIDYIKIARQLGADPSIVLRWIDLLSDSRLLKKIVNEGIWISVTRKGWLAMDQCLADIDPSAFPIIPGEGATQKPKISYGIGIALPSAVFMALVFVLPLYRFLLLLA